MDQKVLARWLKIIIGSTAVAGVLIYLFIVFGIGIEVLLTTPGFERAYGYWAVFVLAFAIPIYMALWQGWKIANNIKIDKSFSRENAMSLSKVAKLAAFDAGFFFVGNIVMWLVGFSSLGNMCITLFICFLGVVASVIMAALSHLTLKAAQLKEESELTI